MDIPDPPCVVRDVQYEPHPLDRETAASGQRDAVFCEQRHDLMHDFLAVQDERQPAEAGNKADSTGGCGLRIGMGDPCDGILAAEVRVAAEGEGAAAFGGFAEGLGEDDGGEAGVDYGVKVFRDGVEADEVAEWEDRGQVKDQFGVEEDAVEYVEVRVISALPCEGRRRWVKRDAFAFTRGKNRVLHAVGRGIVVQRNGLLTAIGGQCCVLRKIRDTLVWEIHDRAKRLCWEPFARGISVNVETCSRSRQEWLLEAWVVERN